MLCRIISPGVYHLLTRPTDELGRRGQGHSQGYNVLFRSDSMPSVTPSARRRWLMTCPSCGTPNPADFMFCLQCGQRLSPAEPAVEVQAETRAELNPLAHGRPA